jgi:hypothetical protein
MVKRPFGSMVGLLLAACGEEAAAPEPEACSAEEAASCLENQKGCADAECVDCAVGSYAQASGQCVPIAGEAWKHSFDEFTAEPGEEISGLCQSWTLGNDEDLWVNAVELTQNQASHHSNWTFVPEDKFDGPDGVWNCDDREYDQLTAAIVGGVLYAQSTQATKEVQKFPDGAAVKIPARSRIIGDVHIINASNEKVTGRANLAIYAVPEASVSSRLRPFHMTYHGLAIPPLASSRFHGTCEVGKEYEEKNQKPLPLKLFYALPHTHSLGTRFFFEASGGKHDGMSLLDISGYNGEARGKLYDPPVDLTGLGGLRFGCEFENPRDEVIHYGLGDQEMCEMLGFIESPIAFESRIDEALEDGLDGDIQVFTGNCDSIAGNF